jgi:hypothetical protein
MVGRKDADDAEQHKRQPQRPLGPPAHGHLIKEDRTCVAQPEGLQRQRHQPERQHRLREEHAARWILRGPRPPQRDPVIASRHLPGDLAVVGFPRVPQPIGPGKRQIQQAQQRQHGEVQHAVRAVSHHTNRWRRNGRVVERGFHHDWRRNGLFPRRVSDWTMPQPYPPKQEGLRAYLPKNSGPPSGRDCLACQLGPVSIRCAA